MLTIAVQSHYEPVHELPLNEHVKLAFWHITESVENLSKNCRFPWARVANLRALF
jgi:hypothetical protein